MITVGAFLSYAIPDTMRIGVYKAKTNEYDGLYDVTTCDKTFGHRQLDSFDIKGGYLVLYLEEEK